MARIETTLAASYQAQTWGLLQGVREIISNALDGEVRYSHLSVGRMTVDYNHRTQTLTVRNDGVTVPSKALLVGTSESREDERAIGMFGEGLPMGLLAMEREDGVSVEIDNGEERWRPAIERSSTFGGEPVLVIHTRKLRQYRDHFEVRIKGVSRDFYEQEVRGMFLQMDSGFQPDQALRAYGGTLEEQQSVWGPNKGFDERMVLLQPSMMGRIYNKGVFVMARPDLMFGYNLTGELNRDRQHMDEWNLRTELDNLLGTTMNCNDSFMSHLGDALFDDPDKLEMREDYSRLRHSDKLVDYVTEKFSAKFTESALPSTSDDEDERIRALGRRPVRVSPMLESLLKQSLGSLSSLEAARDRQPEKVWSTAQLGDVERYNFEMVRLIFTSATPSLGEFSFRVVSFPSHEVPYTVTEKEINISKGVLLDLKNTLLTVARASASATATHSSDGVEGLLATALTRILSGEGTMDLALMLLAAQKK